MPAFPGLALRETVPTEQIGGDRPRIDVSSGVENLGQGISNVGGVLQQRAEQNDTSNLDVNLAQFRSERTKAYLLATPDEKNAPGFNDKFLQDTTDGLSKIADQVSTHTGSLYFQRQAAGISTSMNELVSRGAAEMASQKAVSNYQQTQKHLTDTAYLDPTQFPALMQQHHDAIQAMGDIHGLPPEETAKLTVQGHEDIAKQTGMGYADQNPHKILADLQQARIDTANGKAISPDNYLYFLSGQDLHAVEQRANQVIRFNRIQLLQQTSDALRIQNQQEETTAKDFLGKFLNHNLTIGMIQDALKPNPEPSDPQLKESTAKSFAAMLGVGVNGQTMRSDPAQQDALLRSMYSNDPEKKITQASQILDWPHISPADKQKYIKLLPKSEQASFQDSTLERNFLSAMKTAIAVDPVTGKPDALGSERYAAWSTSFATAYRNGLDGGKTREQLLTPPSPNKPNPDYLGYSSTGFAPSFEERMQSKFQQLGATPQAQPNTPPANTAPKTPTMQELEAKDPERAAKIRAMRSKGK